MRSQSHSKPRDTHTQKKLKNVEIIIIITQKAAIALEPLTTHPDEWAEPSHKNVEKLYDKKQ